MNLFEDLDVSKIEGYVIFLDIDGTIICDDKSNIEQNIVDKVSKLKKRNRIYLCSNSHNHKRNRKVANIVKVEYINTDIKKPSKKILNIAKVCLDDKKLVIGDKFLTDGLFAKNISAEFIKVKRIISNNDGRYIKFLYWIDDLISKII